MKKNSILRVFFVLGFLLIPAISLAEVKISGSFDIWIGNSSRSKPTKSVGNIDDNRFLEKPFVINNKGYSFLRDSYGNKLLLQVEFNSRGEVIQETLYYTNRFTNNCIGVKGDNSFCFTITKDGITSIWDRYNSKFVYFGTFVNVRIRNPYKDSIRYYDDTIFEF